MKKSIFLFFAAILCSVSVWGKNFYSPYIYFNNAEYNWETAMLFVGHDSYSAGYNQKTNPIPDTKLVYFEPDASWGDQTRFTIGNTQNWEGRNEKFDDRVQWMEHIGIQKDYDFNWHQTYYVTGTSSTINVQYISDNGNEGYKSLPTCVAQQNLKIRNTTSDLYSNASDNWPVELKLKGTYLSGKNSSGSSEISGTKSTDGNKYDAIVTGKVTHTYDKLSEDYHFEGWGTADEPTSTNDSYEYNITANTIVYAFLTKKYPVNFSADANGSVTATADEQALTSGNKVVGGTEVTLTATANPGYEFVNWTKAGEEVSTDASYTFTVTEDVDLVANFAKEAYTRTTTIDSYGTICLPFGSDDYTGAEFYEVSYLVEGKGLWLDQVVEGATLVAGKPYIFKATATELVVVSNATEVADPVDGANGLTGTFTDIIAGGLKGNYIIAENKVWVAGAGATLPANRAYIANTVPTTPQAQIPGRRRVCMGENQTTGLDNITNGENTTIKVMENGQLIIIRNGEKFNAQGQRL